MQTISCGGECEGVLLLSSMAGICIRNVVGVAVLLFFFTGSAKRCLLNSACGFNIGERTPRCKE